MFDMDTQQNKPKRKLQLQLPNNNQNKKKSELLVSNQIYPTCLCFPNVGLMLAPKSVVEI